MYRADTIVACATPPGRGGVAVVRLSGPDSGRIGKTLFQATHDTKLEPWRLAHGRIVDPRDGAAFDDALAVRMAAPNSYTGEDVFELQCHGAPLVVERVIAGAVSLGARVAEPGEFSRRAVLNGKLDLLQAEAVADLIAADVSSAADSAWLQLQGALSEELAAIRSTVLAVLADVEAAVDFSDEELPEENSSLRSERLFAARDAMLRLLQGFPAARRRREGHRVVFTGRPNVGKSSLLNALLGSSRVIVSDEPGTTRDVVEEVVDLGGTAVVLTDTAGLRDTPSSAETEAVARARSSAEAADIRVVVLDASAALQDEDRALLGDEQARLVICNKSDLASGLRGSDAALLQRVVGADLLYTSTVDGTGIQNLAGRLVADARAQEAQVGTAFLSRVRHRTAVERAVVAVQAALDRIADEAAPELASIELRTVLDELAAITSALDNEEVLDIIFSEFCIGK